MNYKSPLRLAMENAMNGNHAFTRNNPNPGETKHYFMKWPDDPFSTASEAKIIDVPDDIDPEEFRLNGYKRPSRLSSASLSLQTATPTLSNKSIFDNPPGYQSLLPENNATLSKTSNALTNTSTDLLSGGLKGSLTSNFSTLNNPSNSSFSNESSLFSTSSPYQNDPLWEQLNSYSDEELSELTDMINQAKDEERLYGNSPTKQSLLQRIFAPTPAHAGTLSSQGIENNPIAFKPNSYDFYSQEYTDLIDEIYPDLQFYEGTVEGAYPDSKYLITAGEGYLLDTKERVLKSGVLDELQKKYPDVNVYQMFLKDSEDLVTALKEMARQKNYEDYLTKNPFSIEKRNDLIQAFKEKYPITKEKAKELVYEVYRTERLKPLIQALDQYQINLFELPRPIQRVLMDLDYNPGSSLYRGKGQQSGWHNALTALKKGDYETFLDEISRKGVGHKRNNAVIIRGYAAIDPSIGDVDMESLFQDKSVFKFQDKKLSREFIKNNIHIFRPLFLKHQKKKRR